MKIGLVGQSYQARSLPFNAQRTLNLFPVLDQEGKEVSALYGTPGLIDFADTGAGPVREAFYAANGRAFVVSGSTLYEIDAAGNATSRGTINQSTGNVSMAENAGQLGICDGVNVYTLTYSDNSFARVTDTDLPEAGTLTVIDEYFVVNKLNSGQFFISNIADGTDWAALDFATAESSPDKLLRVYNALGQLWLFGERTTEIWTNTGSSLFPFERIAGAKIEVGILAPHTVEAVSGAVMWLGRDKFGYGIVYRASGFSPERLSNNAIEFAIQSATDLENIKSITYQIDGHTFYMLTGGGLKTSLVLDLTTGQWHERGFLNDNGRIEPHLSSGHMVAFGKHIVGDRRNGKLYEMRMDAYTDAGEEILRERTYTHLSNESQRQRYNALEVGFEAGVGTQSGAGMNPTCSLEISRDLGRTWSNSMTASIGKAGEYKNKVRFRRLGTCEDITFKVSTTAPVKIAIIGSYLK